MLINSELPVIKHTLLISICTANLSTVWKTTIGKTLIEMFEIASCHFRDKFRTQSDIYGGGFLRRWLMTKRRQLFSQNNYSINI